jgi:hypothetical protein
MDSTRLPAHTSLLFNANRLLQPPPPPAPLGRSLAPAPTPRTPVGSPRLSPKQQITPLSTHPFGAPHIRARHAPHTHRAPPARRARTPLLAPPFLRPSFALSSPFPPLPPALARPSLGPARPRTLPRARCLALWYRHQTHSPPQYHHGLRGEHSRRAHGLGSHEAPAGERPLVEEAPAGERPPCRPSGPTRETDPVPDAGERGGSNAGGGGGGHHATAHELRAAVCPSARLPVCPSSCFASTTRPHTVHTDRERALGLQTPSFIHEYATAFSSKDSGVAFR